MKNVRIGTRGSKLALWQAHFIEQMINDLHSDVSVQICIIKTKGDTTQAPLSEIAGRGIFVKDIECALIDNEIDLAVHSAKDMPTEIPPELMLAAVPLRADVRDVLISKGKLKLSELPEKCTIITGSPRRRAQVLRIKPESRFEEIRGNIDTRIKKFFSSDYNGMILAKAGLDRMGCDDVISEEISEDVILPAAGQGALGIEIRRDDIETYEIVRKINHIESELSVKAERAFLRRLGGGCRVPISVLARVRDSREMDVKGIVTDAAGRDYIKDTISGAADNAEELGINLAEKILSAGGEKIILTC